MKNSKATDTLKFLAIHNSWRRGNETVEMQNPTDIGAAIDDAIDLLSKYDELETEIHEQCALNGKGAEREAALLGKVERLERENKRLSTALAYISATINEDSNMSQAECMQRVYDFVYFALHPKNE
jgi:hypothetical protein